jgi:hypothetical protein
VAIFARRVGISVLNSSQRSIRIAIRDAVNGTGETRKKGEKMTMCKLEHDLTIQELRAQPTWGTWETRLVRKWLVTPIEPGGIRFWVVRDLANPLCVDAVKDE